MFLKRNRKYNILKPHIIIFSFFLSFLSLFFIPQISVSAAPVPAHLSLSIVNPNVDFHFNQTENAAATFKQETAVVDIIPIIVLALRLMFLVLTRIRI